MNIDHLIKMANEIGFFFEGESSPEQAPRDVASHIKRFWEARMRREILAHYARGGAGLTDLARAAVGLLAAEAAPAPAAAAAAPKPS
ncbi:MAG TPA: formate dehydrogenase subunit delta [Steroidobacteraceae bacterium]|nr:formate dehydrogenase subunit delta [Steroidobacteraceae bacterium]